MSITPRPVLALLIEQQDAETRGYQGSVFIDVERNERDGLTFQFDGRRLVFKREQIEALYDMHNKEPE